MDIKVTPRKINEQVHGIDIQGEIDVYTSPRVKEAIHEQLDQGRSRLIINLEEVKYIDSTGLGVLIGALKKIRDNKTENDSDGRIILVCTNPQIKKIFNITGLVKIFEISDSEEDALASL